MLCYTFCLLPADSLLHFLTATVGDDMGEGEAAVHDQTTQLHRFGVEVMMSTERTSCTDTTEPGEGVYCNSNLMKLSLTQSNLI